MHFLMHSPYKLLALEYDATPDTFPPAVEARFLRISILFNGIIIEETLSLSLFSIVKLKLVIFSDHDVSSGTPLMHSPWIL